MSKLNYDVLSDILYIPVKSRKKKKKKQPSTKGKTALLRLLKENKCELTDANDGVYFLEFPEGKKYSGCYSGVYIYSDTWLERLEECRDIIGDFDDWDEDDWNDNYWAKED